MVETTWQPKAILMENLLLLTRDIWLTLPTWLILLKTIDRNQYRNLKSWFKLHDNPKRNFDGESK